MTWVLAFPITFKYAVQYAKDFHLLDDDDDVNDGQRYSSAIYDIKRRSGLVGGDRDIPVLCCWVKGNIRCVYGLYVDRDSKTAAIAEKRLHPSFLPPLECSLKLMGLLRTDDGPWWYRYDDTDPQEGDGDIEEADGSVAGDEEGASEDYSESEVSEEEVSAQEQGDVDASGDVPRAEDMSKTNSGRGDEPVVEDTVGVQPELCAPRMENCRV